eukprot:CAMPEP_0196654572 /NCGR_PEP_ID=MMETSP1086-20130531/4295_1 /TAXON_ID=77921 /ORGANISM="Cyanoptyche  gloeocystis , Strain SAG4.97" /LENGTH=131 /DNA_ID=CAMNT_0041986419 /DNA_START=93 /DNA_END=488 /DNA_ORIENTATION=+
MGRRSALRTSLWMAHGRRACSLTARPAGLSFRQLQNWSQHSSIKDALTAVKKSPESAPALQALEMAVEAEIRRLDLEKEKAESRSERLEEEKEKAESRSKSLEQEKEKAESRAAEAEKSIGFRLGRVLAGL